MSKINDTGKNCYVLDEYSNDDEVQFEPAEYWYLDLYIIVLEDESYKKQKYLILEYPSYSLLDLNKSVNSCIWSVPYMAFLIPKCGTKRFTTVKAIRKFYESQIKIYENTLSELANYRFYHMGISDYEKIDGRQYIEYKVSPRQPDKWKCYYVNEHFITGIDRLGLLNLADPEGLHSYRYYPLSLTGIKSEDKIMFAGKPFSTNVVSFLNDSYSKVISSTNHISNELLRKQVYGLVFRIDIVGFTETYNHIVNAMKSLDEDGKEIATHFIARLANIFEKRMMEYGIFQYVIEGDGVYGAFPLYGNIGKSKGFSILLDCVQRIHEDISDMTHKLNEVIILRCSVASGNYFYGKLGGLTSKSQLSGEIFILLSRMDQCLQKCVLEDKNEFKKGLIMAITNNLVDECMRDLKDKDITLVAVKETYREINIDSSIFYKEI